ncbi:MAG: hypothetical protein H6922_02320 [Pseudomonadaceae bacterium]|nr:hypothetical protein [Pseudomonadaceae bacterium]
MKDLATLRAEIAEIAAQRTALLDMERDPSSTCEQVTRARHMFQRIKEESPVYFDQILKFPDEIAVSLWNEFVEALKTNHTELPSAQTYAENAPPPTLMVDNDKSSR